MESGHGGVPKATGFCISVAFEFCFCFCFCFLHMVRASLIPFCPTSRETLFGMCGLCGFYEDGMFTMGGSALMEYGSLVFLRSERRYR